MLRRRGAASPQAAENRYQMKEKLVAIGQDSTIENVQGQRAFYVDGKSLRARDTLILKDAHGEEVCSIQEKVLHVKDTMAIHCRNGMEATVKKAMVAPLRERYTIDIQGAGDLAVQGNITDHEYTIERGGQKMAEISKRWFRVRDTYGVEVEPGADDALILASAAAIDIMSH